MIVDIDDYLAHYGTARKSGRYPWGSGGTENQRNKNFLDYVEGMRKQGLTDTDIAKGLSDPENGFKMTRTDLQAMKTIAKNEQKQALISTAQKLSAKGMGASAIARQMDINESSVRSLLAPGQMEKAKALMSTATMLQGYIDKKGFVDVGAGVEHHLNLSRDRLDKAIAILKEQGYAYHKVQIDQLGTGGNQKTTIKVLAPPGTTYRNIVMNKDKIMSVTEYTSDGGHTWSGLLPPLNISSSRVGVRYKEQGGDDADGVIYVRRGVDDVSLGKNRYAQVRVAVDGSHYLKGMAMYKDDMPNGVDLVFNTVKSDTGNKLDAMKKMQIDKVTGKIDEGNPFGAAIGAAGQIKGLGPDGKERATSVMNMVNQEGDWDKWSRNLSSQMLSKQSPELAKTQLAMTYEKKKQDLDEISALTNPVVRQKLLQSFADSADSSAVHLKAASMPRQSSHVILPVPKMKETEVYAPNFDNGTRVALIRYPHGGIFEIPELTVNNKNPAAIKLLKGATDAIGISAKVAERLSGADFDGDTVLVIPNGKGEIKTAPPLARLVKFDPKKEYPEYDGMVRMTVQTKGTHMGDISNLITDMTIMKASNDELARAVRHSMVVIDAEKHGLDYKRSATEHGIKALKVKYQGGPTAGAATLISRATGEKTIVAKKPRPAKDGGPIDKKTGALVFVPTGENYTRTTVNKKGVSKETAIFNKQRSQKLIETTDARTLLSKDGGTKVEKIYADHSNKLKALANTARLEMVHIKTNKISDSAKAAYKPEVDSLVAKLTLAQRNSPLERQAQVLANAVIAAKRASNGDMEKSELKKIKSQALEAARKRTGAEKQKIVITPNEWAAIQAGAISNDRLGKILDNADLDVVKALATPRVPLLMTNAKTAKAASMAARGYTQAEIAAALGVSVTTLKTSI